MRETPSPIDLDGAPLAAPGLGWTTVAILVASLFLLLANAVALRDWIDDLAPGLAQARASVIAGAWVDATEAIGVGRPRAWLHALWKQAEAARFEGEGKTAGE